MEKTCPDKCLQTLVVGESFMSMEEVLLCKSDRHWTAGSSMLENSGTPPPKKGRKGNHQKQGWVLWGLCLLPLLGSSHSDRPSLLLSSLGPPAVVTLPPEGLGASSEPLSPCRQPRAQRGSAL